jgi:hypothetical protein
MIEITDSYLFYLAEGEAAKREAAADSCEKGQAGAAAAAVDQGHAPLVYWPAAHRF